MPSNIFLKLARKAKHLCGRYEAPEGVIILMYHRVNDALPEHNLVTRTNAFEAQMKFLHRHPAVYRVVDLKDLETRHPSIFTEEGPSSKVIITFDDGYRDNYLNAYPVLRKFNFPATVFLTTGLIGTDDKFNRYAHLRERDMLDWQEINEMLENGISFGAHTVSHPHLPKLSYDEQKREILQSYTCVNEHVPSHKRLSTFCYPYGEYNSDTLKIVQNAGLKCALSVVQGVNTPQTPLHELKRIEVSGLDNIKSFEYKILEKYNEG